MIKNDIQLRHTRARLEELRRQIEEVEQHHLGIELLIFRAPLLKEEKELESEIAEYQQLRELSLEEAVQGPLKEPTLLENTGELLAKLRIAAGFTQQELANRLGWRQPNLSRFESENYSSQTIAKVVEYAASLGIWLHLAPSLTERPPQIVYRREEIQVTTDTTASGFSFPTAIVVDTSPGSKREDSSKLYQYFSEEEQELVYA